MAEGPASSEALQLWSIIQVSGHIERHKFGASLVRAPTGAATYGQYRDICRARNT